MMTDLSNGVIWRSFMVLIPLLVVFIQGMGESGLIDGAVMAILIIVLNATLRVIEVFQGGEAQISSVVNAKPRGKLARILIGG